MSHLRELYRAASIVINLSNHGINLLVGRVLTKRSHHRAQLLCVDISAAVEIEEVEGAL